MKIVVIGGTGRIGSRVVRMLGEKGHEALAASPNTGVDATTGRGLDAALAGAQVVVDVSNAPSFEEAAARAFFESAGRNLAEAERRAGVAHHVLLSVVGTDRLQDSAYFRAKIVQERIVAQAGIPYTVVRATQFFEFLDAIADSGTSGDRVRLPGASFQPIAAGDVADAVVDAALAAPLNGTVEVAGPERMPLSDFVARYLKEKNDPREVVTDAAAGYFGAHLDDGSLVPAQAPRTGRTRLDDWMRQAAVH
ncbi:MAG: SDR family oxidoreductase [bacterium]|nr:SDR family oxidoreductase [bacterium]